MCDICNTGTREIVFCCEIFIISLGYGGKETLQTSRPSAVFERQHWKKYTRTGSTRKYSAHLFINYNQSNSTKLKLLFVFVIIIDYCFLTFKFTLGIKFNENYDYRNHLIRKIYNKRLLVIY